MVGQTFSNNILKNNYVIEEIYMCIFTCMLCEIYLFPFMLCEIYKFPCMLCKIYMSIFSRKNEITIPSLPSRKAKEPTYELNGCENSFNSTWY